MNYSVKSVRQIFPDPTRRLYLRRSQFGERRPSIGHRRVFKTSEGCMQLYIAVAREIVGVERLRAPNVYVRPCKLPLFSCSNEFLTISLFTIIHRLTWFRLCTSSPSIRCVSCTFHQTLREMYAVVHPQVLSYRPPSPPCRPSPVSPSSTFQNNVFARSKR